jgi:hypothetical protein
MSNSTMKPNNEEHQDIQTMYDRADNNAQQSIINFDLPSLITFPNSDAAERFNSQWQAFLKDQRTSLRAASLTARQVAHLFSPTIFGSRKAATAALQGLYDQGNTWVTKSIISGHENVFIVVGIFTDAGSSPVGFMRTIDHASRLQHQDGVEILAIGRCTGSQSVRVTKHIWRSSSIPKFSGEFWRVGQIVSSNTFQLSRLTAALHALPDALDVYAGDSSVFDVIASVQLSPADREAIQDRNSQRRLGFSIRHLLVNPCSAQDLPTFALPSSDRRRLISQESYQAVEAALENNGGK